jgi:hemoglobin
MTDIQTPAAKSLYDQLGGREGISAVVHRLYELIAADPSVSGYFDETGMPVQSLTEFLVIASGGQGDPSYKMPDLAAVHKRFNITEEAFGTVGKYLSQAMTELKVDPAAASAVMNLVVGAKSQIVADNA